MFAPFFLSLCADAYDVVPVLSLVTSGPECGAFTRNRKQQDGHAHVDTVLLQSKWGYGSYCRDYEAASSGFRHCGASFCLETVKTATAVEKHSTSVQLLLCFRHKSFPNNTPQKYARLIDTSLFTAFLCLFPSYSLLVSFCISVFWDRRLSVCFPYVLLPFLLPLSSFCWRWD